MSGSFSGGEKLREALARIDAKLGRTGSPYQLRVGFLEDATYPDGKSVAYIAAIQEFGATIRRPAGTATIYRSVGKGGKLLRKGRFVKKAKANFIATHAHGAYTITIPPRPFFRNMIKANASHWGTDLAAALSANDLDGAKALAVMGEQIAGELRQSINDTNSPPLAPSTVLRKGGGTRAKLAKARARAAALGVAGPDKPLIDTGVMWNSIDYAVDVPSAT